MMRYLYTVLVCCILGLASCGGSAGNKSSSLATSDTSNAKPQSKLNDAGTNALAAVVNSYYSLKNALVATNGHDAQAAGGQMAAKAGELQTVLATDSANRAALAPYLDTIVAEGKSIAAVADSGCEHYRLAFGTVSSAMYGLMRSAGLKNSGAYREYCPMAFNEKGAYWLSRETEIKNPYFGKKMIECGEVTDTL